MYIVAVILLMLVCPGVCVVWEAGAAHSTAGAFQLIAKWFVFWIVGIRLFTAGIRQALQPGFTAREIFGMQGGESHPLVREIGFATLSLGTLGICSLYRPGWLLPAALAGGMFYGLAGLMHFFRRGKNALEWTATISDAFAFVVLLAVLERGWAVS